MKENNSNNHFDIEKRKYPRLNTSVDINYNVTGKVPRQQQKSVTKNISAGGICLIVYEDIEVGAILNLKFNLGGTEDIIEAKGVVVWRSSFSILQDKRMRYDVGIEFIDIPENDRQKISEYVLRLVH